MKKIDKAHFNKVVSESKTMRQASITLGLHFNTFVRWAKKFNCYQPNQGAKGCHRPKVTEQTKDKVEEILAGQWPTTQTYKLKTYLLRFGYKENRCERCGLTEWNGRPIAIELHHKNGVNHDHRLENLEMLCPNCHSQTDTFRSKNKNRAFIEESIK